MKGKKCMEIDNNCNFINISKVNVVQLPWVFFTFGQSFLFFSTTERTRIINAAGSESALNSVQPCQFLSGGRGMKPDSEVIRDCVTSPRIVTEKNRGEMDAATRNIIEMGGKHGYFIELILTYIDLTV